MSAPQTEWGKTAVEKIADLDRRMIEATTELRNAVEELKNIRGDVKAIADKAEPMRASVAKIEGQWGTAKWVAGVAAALATGLLIWAGTSFGNLSTSVGDLKGTVTEHSKGIAELRQSLDKLAASSGKIERAAEQMANAAKSLQSPRRDQTLQVQLTMKQLVMSAKTAITFDWQLMQPIPGDKIPQARAAVRLATFPAASDPLSGISVQGSAEVAASGKVVRITLASYEAPKIEAFLKMDGRLPVEITLSVPE